jgi:hypothetical protein
MPTAMNAQLIRRALRALLPNSADEPRSLVVQHLGFECSELDTLPAVLDDVGRELGLTLRLDGVTGDVVLAEQGFVDRVAPQVLHAFLEERPLMTVARPDDRSVDVRRRVQRLHSDLVLQLRQLTSTQGAPSEPFALSQSTTLPPSSNFDSAFDSRQHAEQLAELDLDPDRAELLNILRRGLVDPTQPRLTAGYGRKATLSIDFATGVALIDELADQCLRVTQEMPYLARGAQPGVGASERDLDLVVWDIALAAGGFRLLHSPVNWWHAALVAQPRLTVSRYTTLPQHRALARELARGPCSPAELRRRCRVSLADLRGFLQACLFLGLANWMP